MHSADFFRERRLSAVLQLWPNRAAGLAGGKSRDLQPVADVPCNMEFCILHEDVVVKEGIIIQKTQNDGAK